MAILILMVDTINITAIMSIAGIIITLGGAWLTLRRISKDSEKDKKAQSDSILKKAKEEDAQLELRLYNKIHDLENQIIIFKETHTKDIDHLKETYNNEIKFLGQKIEALREEVRSQHTQLVQLLSKMIGRSN